MCVFQVREEEMEELEQMLSSFCELPAAGGVENGYGKVNILLQTYISRGEVDSFSLISDLSFVAQVSTCANLNVPREKETLSCRRFQPEPLHKDFLLF